MRRDAYSPNLRPQVLIRTNLPPATNFIPVLPRASAQLETNLTGSILATNTPDRTRTTPATNVSAFPRVPQNLLEVQVALDRLGISSGSLDGVMGSQTRAALRAYQKQTGLPQTGEWDAATRHELLITRPVLTTYPLTTNDLASLQPLSGTWMGKSRQTALAYESALELVAEKGHAHPSLVRRLNPGLVWTNLTAGTLLMIPDVAPPPFPGKAAWIVIRLAEKTLQAFDANASLLLHFPCSIARHVEKRPVGELHVVVVAPNPNYTFDPALFHESAEARTIASRLVLAPGPNNPVGVAWIGLDRPGYGMHGTPSPEQVGRTESHGCFRLANWNAELLVKYVYLGLPVRVEP
jgi:lipoprotein-anchoring transpeptidase ErfK/SrfK